MLCNEIDATLYCPKQEELEEQHSTLTSVCFVIMLYFPDG